MALHKLDMVVYTCNSITRRERNGDHTFKSVTGYIVSSRSGIHKIVYGKKTRFRVVFVWKIDFIITFLKAKSLLLTISPPAPNLELILCQYFNQSNSLSSVLIARSRNLGELNGKVYIMY